MIERTRPYPDADELAALYAVPNDADRWPEHQLRTDITVALGRSRFPARRLIIDPAAGALVGAGGVGEAIAHHPVAPLQRRADQPLDVVAPGGVHQQGLGQR